MDLAYLSGRVAHMEDHIGATHRKYWRRDAQERKLKLGYTVWREIRQLRDGGVSALDAFERVGRKYGLSASLAQKWFYAQERYFLNLPARLRQQYAHAPRLALVALQAKRNRRNTIVR